MNFDKHIETHADFPKKGVVYFDTTCLLQEPKIFQKAVNQIENHFKNKTITKIAAIESKGFPLGTAIAKDLELPLSLIRKPHLTPGKTNIQKFIKEYGFGEYQVKIDAFNKNDKVLIVYDIFAGSGATDAAIKLVEKSGAKVIGCAYIVELEYLHGRKDLESYDCFSLVKYSEKKLK